MKSWLFSSLLMFTALNAFADSPFDGTWTADVVRPAPLPQQHLTLSLKTENGKVSGTVSIQGGPESPIEWGFVKNDLITFKVKLPFQNGMPEFVHLGRIDGGRLMLGRRPEDLTQGQLVEFVAERSK